MQQREIEDRAAYYPEDSRRAESLGKQIDSFLRPLIEANSKRTATEKRLEEEYAFLKSYYGSYVTDRNKRASEINSREYNSVISLAGIVIPHGTYQTLCIDDGVLPPLMHGFSAGMAANMKLLAGVVNDFVIDAKTQRLKLKEGSHFDRALDKAFTNEDVIYQEADSHMVCLARAANEIKRKGKEPEDHGLYRDIVEKMHMVVAMKNHVSEKYNGAKKVIPIQVSFIPRVEVEEHEEKFFDPGFMLMGLETKLARDHARRSAKESAKRRGKDPRVVEPEYTNEVLKYLVEQRKIIYTGSFLEDSRVMPAFERHRFNIDWQGNYVKSASKFWKSIVSMQELLPIFAESVRHVYPNLADDTQEAKDELQERSVLLLTNAFSGYLLNPSRGEVDLMIGSEVSVVDNKYEYAEHKEQGIDITEGGYGPYSVSTFEVSSLDPENMRKHTETAISLVRGNRYANRVIDGSGNFLDPQQFAGAIVPIAVSEIIRDEDIEAYRAVFSQIDWSDMPPKWDTMSSDEFDYYIIQKSRQLPHRIPIELSRAIKNLRDRMALLYHQATSGALIKQEAMAMPVIVSKNREILGIVPFVKVGFD